MIGAADSDAARLIAVSRPGKKVSMSEYRLPDFVIIGAAKAATTWLSYNLSAHPEVLLPSQELHYFSRFHGKGQDWYRAHFRDAQETQLIGEKSASYLADPATPLRLHGLMPRAKLIAQLRNPIERAYSDYCMHYRRGEVSRDIARYLDPERTPIPRLLDHGFYYRQLMSFMRVFPPEQIRILLYDDIRQRPSEVFADVCGFLGIDAAVAPQRVESRVKDKATPVIPPAARRLLAPLKDLVAPYRQTRAFAAVRGLFARTLRYPPLTPALRERLAALYAEDIANLSELLRRDLSIWSCVHAGEGAGPAGAGNGRVDNAAYDQPPMSGPRVSAETASP
jgi:Sulfotransferase domain